MRSIWHCPWFLIPVLLLFIAALSFTLYFPYGSELFLLNSARSEPLNTFFLFATKLGEEKIWLIVTLGLFFVQRRYAFLMLLTMGIVALVAGVVKHYAGVLRTNSWMELNNLKDYIVTVPFVKLLGGYTSMPSGHTMLAFAMCSLATLMLPTRYRIIGLALAWTAFLAGLSRMFLVQHFLRDVLVGATFGLLISDLVWQLDRKFIKKWWLLILK